MGFDSKDNICVLGAGTMGCQITLVCAKQGNLVWLYSRSKEGKLRAKQTIVSYIKMMESASLISKDEISEILNRIQVTSRLKKAVSESNMILETIAEDFDAKKELYVEIGEWCQDDALILTNTSSFLPSDFAPYVKKAERFCALHFYTYIWNTGIADVMVHDGTSEHTKEKVIAFAKSLDIQPVVLQKENKNYVFNAILFEALFAAIKLYVDGVAKKEDIEDSWKKVLNVAVGPFGILEVVGLDTAYRILKMKLQEHHTKEEEQEKYLDCLRCCFKKEQIKEMV